MKILYCSFGVTNWSLDGASGLENWAGGILGELTNPILGELIIELLEGGGASKGIESFSGGDRITSFLSFTRTGDSKSVAEEELRFEFSCFSTTSVGCGNGLFGSHGILFTFFGVLFFGDVFFLGEFCFFFLGDVDEFFFFSCGVSGIPGICGGGILDGNNANGNPAA